MSIGGFLYWRYLAPRLVEQRDTRAGSVSETVSPPGAGEQATTAHPSLSSPEGKREPAASETRPPAKESAEDGQQSFSKSSPAHSDDSATPVSAAVDPQHLVNELDAFYDHLDHQAYMKDFDLKESSKVHFSRLLQKLMDNPPVVIRETDDMLTLLKNTAHFCRILDKDNITILKGILDRDRQALEPMLKAFYNLTDYPEYLQKEYSLTIDPDALRDYAAFFLNTIGGRLYLFRRDSASRMTISYYAILVIDRANREGNNPLGIDLRPAINSLIEEIENTGKSLKFREEYLDKLYDLKQKYN